ncbi:MAG: DUF2207 domain-containing protein [Peptococcaceae bacterium]|nr:DUF2207 domain-containing protein [Candidatus Syntrophopropionicum ammoniitolerans]
MRKRTAFATILTAILLLTLTVTGHCTGDRSYFMSSFNVEAQLDSSGDMAVSEEISYEFDGSFRGVYRTLKSTGSDGIEDIRVYEVKGGRLNEFTRSTSEADNTYQLLEEGDGITIKLFSAAQDESKTFRIQYKVINVATRYNDTAELYWKFMGGDTEVDINNFSVTITLPEGAAKEEIRVFGHGPLSGVSEIIDARTVGLKVEQLLPHNFVEARVLFPPGLIKDSAKIVNREALAEILAEEEEYADRANVERAKARVMLGLSLAYALLELLLIIFLYIKYDKEYKTGFTGQYFRELPGDYSPAVLSVLWNFGSVKPRDLTATLMDLVRRKVLKLRAGDEYTFELIKDANLKGLSPHERHLVDWLIGSVGDGAKVSLDEIEKYSNTKIGARRFKTDYDAWVEQVKAEAEKNTFFDKSTVRGNIFGVLAAVAGLAFGILTAALYDNFFGLIVLVICSGILFIYSLTIRRRSEHGALQFKKWKAFRRFLTHFSRIDKAELPAVILWEHYLVYAITLGVAKEAIDQLRLVFTEDDFKDPALTYMYYGHYGPRHRYFDTIDNVTGTMVKTTESIYNKAVSKSSSGSGSGGGFSSGGGGGGGGGGAGAF